MATMKEKLFFNYDGVWSSQYGLLHVNVDNGMFEEALTATRTIIETKVKGKDKPHFGGLEHEPLEFEMAIAFEDGFDDKKVERVISWLFQDYYKPLYFEGKENRVYYCMPVDDPRIIHNGLGGGYITLNMRCNSPFIYSPVFLSEFLDLSVSGIGEVNVYNDGYGILYPEISITKVGSNDLLIRNVNNGGGEFVLTGIQDGEELYIHCEKEIIKSDAESIGVYRYNNASGEFPYLTEGHNRIQVEGRCQIQFRYQFKYRF